MKDDGRKTKDWLTNPKNKVYIMGTLLIFVILFVTVSQLPWLLFGPPEDPRLHPLGGITGILGRTCNDNTSSVLIITQSSLVTPVHARDTLPLESIKFSSISLPFTPRESCGNGENLLVDYTVLNITISYYSFVFIRTSTNLEYQHHESFFKKVIFTPKNTTNTANITHFLSLSNYFNPFSNKNDILHIKLLTVMIMIDYRLNRTNGETYWHQTVGRSDASDVIKYTIFENGTADVTLTRLSFEESEEPASQIKTFEIHTWSVLDELAIVFGSLIVLAIVAVLDVRFVDVVKQKLTRHQKKD